MRSRQQQASSTTTRSGHAALDTLGRLRLGFGDDRGAIEAFERCLEREAVLGRPDSQATILINLAYCSFRLGEHTASAEYCTRARDLFEEAHDDIGVGRTLLMLGSIFRELNDPVEALRAYEAILSIDGADDDIEAKRLDAKARFSIGQVHRDMGDFTGALDDYHRALALFEELADPHSPILVRMEIAMALKALDEVAAATEQLQIALPASKAIGDRHLTATLTANLGSCLADLERFDEALTALESARDELEELALRPTLREVYKPLAELYERNGDLERAMEHLKKHVVLTEELSIVDARKRVHAIAAARQIAIAEKNAEIERYRSVELAAALDQLKQAQTQLVHAEKMASLGTLTAGIAHEINNPVNFIRASTGPLRRDFDALRGAVDAVVEHAPEEYREEARSILARHDVDELGDEVDALLRGIEEGALRTGEIVRSLRTFSRLDEDELKPADLHEGIESTLTLLDHRLASMRVVRELGALPLVTCYPGQLNQVFMNLIANAIDACGDTGTITIATSESDGAVTIAISDTGAGIASEHLPKIFEPFFTTKPVGSGQGLGLAIAHSIIERHGGTIEVESTVGVGTRVAVRVPVGG
jgi:signal transduction histidine kinase